MYWTILRRVALFGGFIAVGVSTGGIGIAGAGTAVAVSGGTWGAFLGGVAAGADKLITDLHRADRALRKKKRRR